MRPTDFELIFRQAPTAFSIVDLEGRQIDGSDHYWDLFGIDPSEVDGDEAVVTRLTAVDDTEITRQYFDQLTSGAIDEITLEKRYLRADGRRFWGRLRANPIKDEAGNIIAVAGVITDISAEREARKALVASEVERSKTDHRVVADAITQFVGEIEHQVRSPLHSILGLTELLTNGASPTAKQLVALHAEALRLQQIVEEISDFSKQRLETVAAVAPPRHPSRLDDRWKATLSASAAGHRRDAHAADVRTPSTPHVLVVDDGEVNRLLAVSQLQRLGYTSVTAGNGLEAVDRAADGSFDAILMDWHMPVLDGLDAARQIRRNEASGPRVPIIAITAAAVAGHRTTCLAAGMDDVLLKPVAIETLHAVLRRWIPLAPPSPFGPDDATGPGVTSLDRPSIDPEALDELERETGDRNVVDVIITTYLDELDLRLVTIGSTAEILRLGDMAAASELIRSSHTLKSTAALVGATRLSELCEQLQILVTDRPGPEAEVRAATLADMVIAEARRGAIDLEPLRSNR